MESVSLEELRLELAQVDKNILELVAKRQKIALAIGASKRTAGKSTRNFEQEGKVFLRAQQWADDVGVSHAISDKLMEALIDESLSAQEKAGLAESGKNEQGNALVIGGAGKLGKWFVSFLQSQGYSVDICEKAPGATSELQNIAFNEIDLSSYALAVVATPLSITSDVLSELANKNVGCPILEVASLKAPVAKGIAELRARGHVVASIHPMFGPDTRLLSQRFVLISKTCEEGELLAQKLFADTMATVCVMDATEHDRLMSFVLGLSHAINIIFASALSHSGNRAPDLEAITSSTFDAQLKVSERVLQENPDLYFEIQSENGYGRESLSALWHAFEEFRSSVIAKDRESFRKIMKRGRDFMERRASNLHG